MQEIIVDEGKIKCLITGKMRKATPEEYVRQEYCRILLDVYKYPKSHIDVEYSIKVGSTDKRCDIIVFNDEEKSQDNIYWIVETKKKMKKRAWISCGAICLRLLPVLVRGQMAIAFYSIIKMLLVLIAILNFLIFLNIKKVLIQSVSIISLIW